MSQRRWFLALLPVAIQSVVLMSLAPRFGSFASKAVIFAIGLVGIASAVVVHVLATSESHASEPEEEATDQMSFLFRKARQDNANDLRVLNGLLQLGDTRKAMDYLRHAAQKIEIDNEILKTLGDRVAIALFTGQGIAFSEGTELAIEIDRMEKSPPECAGLGGSLERTIAYAAAACHKAGSGRLHLKCSQKAERWQIRLACTGPMKDEEMENLVRQEKGMGNFNIRATQEVDRGSVFIYDFPRRTR